MNIKSVVEEFADRLQTLIEGEAMARARGAVLSAFGVAPKRGPGRPPKSATAVQSVAKKARKKPPLQLCPVPGCKNPAAPVFGMVCAKHKDVKKSLIKQYREARKAKKDGVKVVAKKAAKRRPKPAPKKAPKKAPKRGAVAKPAPKATPAAAAAA
jgi:hypothetical protein